MTHRGHNGTLGVFAIVAAIAFAFGVRTAQVVVAVVLLFGVAFFTYVMFRIITGTV